jgi:hypothetical protein
MCFTIIFSTGNQQNCLSSGVIDTSRLELVTMRAARFMTLRSLFNEDLGQEAKVEMQ